MIGASSATAEAGIRHVKPGSVFFDHGGSTWQGQSQRFLSIAGNVLVALFYAVFFYSAWQFWRRTGSFVGGGQVVFNTILVACLLTRRGPTAVTGSLRNWVLAPLSQVIPFLIRPVDSASWQVLVVSSVGQLVGIGIMIASLIVLNRCIGVVAANRGVKTRGLYGWVRHPLYAGEVLFFVSFLISNWSYHNILFVFALVLAQVLRLRQEEALLGLDDRYRAYQVAVPYRLLPGVF